MSSTFHEQIEDISPKKLQMIDSNNNGNEKLMETEINEEESIASNASAASNETATLSCELCNIKVTSLKILQRHLEGRKHKMRFERNGKTFHCDLCDVTANSETQLNIHMRSSKHKARLTRKEYNEFIDVSAFSKNLWIVMFCILCIFLNLLLVFKFMV